MRSLSRHRRPRFRKLRFLIPRSAAEAGYNIVVLAVAVTVLNILVAKALPLWSTQIQREKEEELIFRGLQYAEAIRVFQIRNQRLPTKLEELVEIKPRAIRQLWKNPMTEDGEWGLLFQDMPTNPQQQQNQNQRPSRGSPDRDGRGDQEQSRFGLPRDGQEVRVGPIIGVYSPEGGEAIKVFSPLGGGGGGDIGEWRFEVSLLQGFGQRGIGTPDGAIQVPTMNAADIGRPWPPGIQLPRFQGGRNPIQNQNPGGISGQNPQRGNQQGGQRPGGGNLQPSQPQGQRNN